MSKPTGRPPKPLTDRFNAKVQKGAGEDACWLWTASKDKDGYGWIKDETGRQVYAHRVAYELHHGVKLAPEQVVQHRCDTPSCVRPDHLLLGTVASNNADRAAKGRSAPAKGSANNNAKLTEEQVLAIKQDLAAKMSRKDVAAKHGLLHGHVKLIDRGKRWAHLEPGNS